MYYLYFDLILDLDNLKLHPTIKSNMCWYENLSNLNMIDLIFVNNLTKRKQIINIDINNNNIKISI